MKYLIVVDIEATCWKGWEHAEEMETIEIGAVKLNQNFEDAGQFTTFVKPVIHPQLSDFCVNFTSIQQADVDQADLFPAAFDKFLAWIGEDAYLWFSWSSYDAKRLHDDLVYHSQPIPKFFDNHHDLKKLYAQKEGLKERVGMRRALKNLKIDYSGRQHRALDDALNTAHILRYVLKQNG
ncbi:MAG: 3'-5' exonuclease [Chloroflexota bacterium]